MCMCKTTHWRARFEWNRLHEGKDEEYKKTTQGAGGTAKKNKLLRGWILDKGTCGKHYLSSLTTFQVEKERKVEEQWLSQKEATDKYGEKQLKAMIEAGTIRTRRLRHDPRFFEFKAFKETGSTSVKGTKSTTAQSSSSKALDNKALLPFSKLLSNFDDLNEDDFEDPQSGDEGHGLDADLAKALGVKTIKPPQNKTQGQNLETLSKISKSESGPQLKEKLLTFKLAIEKQNVVMDAIYLRLKKAGEAEAAKALKKSIDKLDANRTALQKMCKGPFKREDLKITLLASYKVIVDSKNIIKKLKKDGKLKPETKAKKVEEEEEDEEEDAEE